MKKLFTILLCVLLVASMVFGITGCKNKAPAEPTAATMAEGKTLGKGKTEFTFTVVDGEGKSITSTVKTDKTTVGEALVELGLVEGEQSEWGLYVKTVNGVTADYDKDGTYWAFYINGEYAMTGVDATDIEAGATYMFQVEKG